MLKKQINPKIFLFVLIPVLVIALLAGIGFALVYKPVKELQASIVPLQEKVAILKTVGKENDIDKLNAAYKDVGAELSNVDAKAQKLYFLKPIPFAGNYAKDLEQGMVVGHKLYEAGGLGLEAITPYADLIGFKKGATGGIAGESTEGRLQTAVLTLDKVMVKVDDISQKLNEADSALKTIDPARYPEKFKGMQLRSNLEQGKKEFDSVTSLFSDAKPFLKALPTMLGKDKEITYLLLFQNDKERRATGGFLTSYAFFSIKDGKMTVEKSEDTYSLDQSIKNHPPAPREIATYHKNVSQFYIRDSNLSPDVPTSVADFMTLYDKSSQKKDFDGVVFLDSKILVDMLTTFGDTYVDGVTFSSQPDKRCNGCPQVIYQLSDIVDRPVNYIKENRKGILGDLMHALFFKAIGFSPSKYWGPFSQQLVANLQQKHIQMYFKDKTLQSAVESINFAGRMQDVGNKDFLHVNNVNFAGAKSNLFVRESITSKTDGNKREVEVVYVNPEKGSNCNLEAGQLCLNATLRNWVRIYVPQGSKLTSFDGNKMDVKTYDELGKTVFETFMTVDPQGKATIKATYEVPSSVDTSQLYVQKQAGVDTQKLKVLIGNKKVFDGDQNVDLTVK